MGQARKPKTLVVARAPADSGTKTAYRPRNQDDSRAWSHVLHKGGPTRLLRRGRHDARAPKIMSDGRRASRGQPRTPAEVLQRVWWAGDGKGGDRDRPQAVSQVRAPRHAPWTQRAAPKLGTDVPQHPQKTARTLVRLLRASEALWASCTRLEHRNRGCGFNLLGF